MAGLGVVGCGHRVAGGVLITRWAIGLLVDTGKILLDSSVDSQVVDLIRSAIETDTDNQVCDLHVWWVDFHHLMATVSLVTSNPQYIEHYRSLLDGIDGFEHVIIEVNACD